jgi:cytoskeletal protein RodZ
MKKVEMNGKGEGVAVKPDPEPPNATATAPAEKEAKKTRAEAPVQEMAKTLLRENKRLLVLVVGALLFMLIVALAFYGMLNTPSMKKKLMATANKKGPVKTNSSGSQTSVTSAAPILDASHPTAQNTDGSRVTAELVGQTAKKQPKPATPTTLGGVKPFDSSQPWHRPISRERSPLSQPMARVAGRLQEPEMSAI